MIRRITLEDEYIVWGYGEYGKLAYELLKISKKNVLAIIDKNIPNMELCDGTPIMNATDKFVEECTAPIIVASPKYENEIQILKEEIEHEQELEDFLHDIELCFKEK